MTDLDFDKCGEEIEISWRLALLIFEWWDKVEDEEA